MHPFGIWGKKEEEACNLNFSGLHRSTCCFCCCCCCCRSLIRRADNATALWVLLSIVYFHFCIPHSPCLSESILRNGLDFSVDSLLQSTCMLYSLALPILYTYAIETFLSVEKLCEQRKEKGKRSTCKSLYRLIFVLPSKPYHTIYSIFHWSCHTAVYAQSPLIRFIKFCC